MKVFITGGGGFLGINTTIRFLQNGCHVTLFDNLSKKGSFQNIDSISEYKNWEFVHGDLRNPEDIEHTIKKENFDVIFHFGSQTAVTTSLINPMQDFQTNAFGTFCLLECIRKYSPKSLVIYSSTNKVYGDLEHYYEIIETDTRYKWKNKLEGISEQVPLDLYSPYGCSKGAADCYMKDYARIYGLHTIILRQSCIYGKYQNGTEDQGWLAWFIKAFLEKQPITLFGSGKQVRDTLYIKDLINLYEKIVNTPPQKGSIFNIGGGYKNSISLIELIKFLEEKIFYTKIEVKFQKSRAGDQKIFISNNSKALSELG